MSIHIQNRRAFLKAGSTILALPLLESMGQAKTPAASPKRILIIGCGFGFTSQTFFPTEAGRFADIGLTSGLKPLERHKNDISMVSNLTNLGASSPHSGSTSYLTGANVQGTPGKKFHNSVSLDQVVARKIGADTRFPTLTLSDDANKDGHGPGLSLAWSDKGHPIPGLNNPLDVYHQLYGQSKETKEEREFRLAEKRSILDGVLSDVRATKPKLSKSDQGKLEDYFESVRQIEHNLSRQAEWAQTPKPKSPVSQPKEEQDGLQAIKTMHRLMVAAFQTDSTRVITYRQPVASVLQGNGINLNPHSLSHYGLDPRRREASEQKDVLFMELLASLIDLFKSTEDLNGQNLFDSSLISYGSNLRSGHGLKGCPSIYTGGAAKNLKSGEHIVLPEQDTPLANYWLTLMQSVGVPLDRFSHSTGTLGEIVT